MLKKATRILGFISSCCTVAVGIIHVLTLEAKIHWPSAFFEDVNMNSWRMIIGPAPTVIAMNWSPILVGAIGMGFHIEGFASKSVTQSFVTYLLFLLFQAFFSNLGYAGGLGIVIGTLTLVVCLLCLINYFIDDDEANMKINLKLRNRG